MSHSKPPLRTSTLRNAMIVALEPIEFIPCGRHVMGNHPGVSCLHLQQAHGIVRLDRSLIGSFSKVSLNDKSRDSEVWELRKYKDAEEEFYVCGNTIVWSRGYNVINTFTIDSPVKHAVWCSFTVDGEDLHLQELFNDETIPDKKKTAVEGFAAVSDGSLHVFTRNGDDFLTALPFQVRKVWNCDFGLIFERNQSQNLASSVGLNSIAESTLPSDNSLTTVFCLQHPLREFAPIVKKFQGGVRYVNRSREVIVFCEENLVMTFDSKHGLHTVWKMRKITQDDVNSLENNLAHQQQMNNQLSGIRQMSISSPGTSPMRASFRGSPAAPILPNIGSSGANSHPSIPIGLARTPHTNKNPSFAHLSHTPNSSRLCSPSTASINYPSHAFSPLRNSPHLVRSPSTPISHESLCLNDSVHESAEPLRPEVCFEHVWSESIVGTREGLNIGPATRAFLTKDVCGQKFLAYFIDSLRQLRIVKYGLSNDLSQFIFGAVSSFSARDAAPLKELKMIAVLDVAGSITLFTGSVKMVKMHVTGVPVMSLSLSHGLRNATPALGTPQPVSTPAHPSRPGSVLGNMEEVGLLSPVPELTLTGETDLSLHTIDGYPFASAGHSPPIMSLPHAVGSNLLLEVSGGAFYKAEVPQFCTTSLVQACMKALHHVLPSDTYLQLTIKWYAVRHCPGSMASYQSEWAIFVSCLREVIGYSNLSIRRTSRSQQMEADTSVSPVVAAKKARHFEQGNPGDWEYLLQSSFHKKFSTMLSPLISICAEDENLDVKEKVEEPKFELLNKSRRRSSLDRSTDRAAPPICAIFCALHLVYEEQKLNMMTWDNIPKMSKFLQQLAIDIGLHKFSKSYAMDNPDLISRMPTEEKEFDPLMFRMPACFSSDLEPNIFANLYNSLQSRQSVVPFPIIPGVTERTKHLLTIYDCLFGSEHNATSIVELGPFTKSSTFKREKSIEMEEELPFVKSEQRKTDAAHMALKYMIEIGITNEELCTIPHGAVLPILTALHQCKESPDLDFPEEALKLIGRHDLLLQNSSEMSKWKDAPLSSCTDPRRSGWQPTENSSNKNEAQTEREDRDIIAEVLDSDPTLNNNNNPLDRGSKKLAKTQNQSQDSADDNITRLLFPNDHRISEVRRLLQAEKPVRIDLTQQAGVSAHDFTEQTRTRLIQLCNRTVALAVGRGMVSLQTEKPVPTEPFQIPSMDLTGRSMPGNTTVDLEGSGSDVPSNMKDWPLFHNGVAAGLKIMPQTDNSSWIYLNKATSNANNANGTGMELSPEHAGFLLAAGLNGHLEKLHTLKIHDYLTRTHEMTTVGLLLGLGASKCGSCDLSIMRLLSVHVPALLPPTSTEFDVPRVVQTAAVTAVGFLYLGSAQRLVAEVMLREIDRPPSPENDNGQDREAYALSCGLALGTITLGRGGNIPELADLNIPDQLYHYMTGKRKHSSEPVVQSIILEGDLINTEVTAPGAILALSLMFLKTNNVAVAEWFTAPETLLLLETIKPQHLMLRTLAGSLILWDFVTPTKDWVESHVPEVIRAHITSGNLADTSDDTNSSVDAQTVLQCHASILAGACLALGIRFAGSQNKSAYNTLRHYVLFFLSMWNEQSGSTRSSYPLEVMGKYTLETCLTACLLALSMVIAGSGDMETLQICRFLHVKLGPEINYGMQMAMHMALGFLFLGGCRQTLCTSNKAVAALLTSIYPCFPYSSSDNQYHLQALRHFYVLATEQRLLVPIDSVSNLPCYAQIGVKFLPAVFGEEHPYTVMAPCMLPESNQLKEVSVSDPRHWPLVIDVQLQPEKLKQVMDCGLSVQRRTGFQPYIQDPKGHRSLLARSSDFSKSSLHWNALLSDDAFNTRTFTQVYLDSFHETENLEDTSKQEARNTAHLSSLTKNFVTLEKSRSLHAFSGLQQIANQIQNSTRPCPLGMWQLIMAVDFLKKNLETPQDSGRDDMTGPRFIALLAAEVERHFGKSLEGAKPALVALLGLGSNKTRTTRPKREAKRKDPPTLEVPGVLPFTNRPRTFGIPTPTLWTLSCFLIFNSLPRKFLFPQASSEGSPGELPSLSGQEIMNALQNRGIRGKGAVQIYKALQS